MTRVFNVSADCKPGLHYMVDIGERLCEIRALVDKGEYFAINRARQYGKTTTLRALKEHIQKDYIVVSMDFQRLDAAKFENGNVFSLAFASYFLREMKKNNKCCTSDMKKELDMLQHALDSRNPAFSLYDLFEQLSRICGVAQQPIVLMIDEVDSASNNQVFLDFLAQLRGYYIDRDETPAFWSVILAGVYDIKNLKMKIRPNDEHKLNSPWNIAADFAVDMSLPEAGIAGMLADYEKDYQTGMDIREMARLIYEYTSGYPFLVSRICKLMDERIAGGEGYPDKKAAWTKEGFLAAVRMLLVEQNTLFESLTGKLDDFPELNQVIFTLLFTGKSIAYNPDHDVIAIAGMFGFIKNKNGNVAIANRIFETRLYNRFLSEKELQYSDIYKAALQDKNQFVIGGHLNMKMVLEKFVVHFHDLYRDRDETFLEEDGRKYFLLYLRPIITVSSISSR